MKTVLWLTALILLLPGCAAYMPMAPSCTNATTDARIYTCAGNIQNFYDARSAKAKILGTSGAIGLAALATGGSIASQRGASAGGVSMIVTIGNFIGQLLGLVDPPDRANAYDSGSGDLADSKADYLGCIANPDGTPRAIPTSGSTICGAAFYKRIGAVGRTVNDLLRHARPAKEDLDLLTKKFSEIVIPIMEEVKKKKEKEIPNANTSTVPQPGSTLIPAPPSQ